MLFLNPWLLLGLIVVAVPIALHLFNRRQSQRKKWGAILFLAASLAQRRRKILIEEILLLVTRCLIAAFAALAFARPFAQSDSSVTWILTGVAAIIGVILLASTAAAWQNKALRKRLLIAGTTLALFAIGTSAVDGIRNLIATTKKGAKDVAIILDGSSSMSIKDETGTDPFAGAKKLIDDFIEESERNTSFALIIGGANPLPLTPTPISDRKVLFRLLDEATPIEGTFHAPDAIALAASVLSMGANGTKQIVIFGDGQSTGWELESEESWGYINEILKELPGQTKIIWRSLGLPGKLRNLTVQSLSFSRDIIGTDREVRIDTVIANNGDEAATAKSVILSAEGRTYTDETIGQLQPGERKLISFRHHFKKTGTHPVRAIVEINDDLSSDNSLTQIAPVRGSIKVLVVEGTKARRLSERPGAFIALSLAPAESTINPSKPDKKNSPKNNSELRIPNSEFFARPTLISAAELDTIEDLSAYSAIVLADIPKLPATSAKRLAEYSRLGGGLMVISASRADSAFYNGWKDENEQQIMPLTLLDDKPGRDPLPLDPKTITHEAIRHLSEKGDLSSAIFEECRKTTAADQATTIVGARLINGDALFAYRTFGKGRILQFASAIDPAGGNLISRQSFLPMIHELIYSLAEPVTPKLNLEPATGASITLGSNPFVTTNAATRGLRALYRRDNADGELIKLSVDTQISQNWNRNYIDKNLAHNAPVYAEWTGSITIPKSSTYKISTRSSGSAEISFPNDKKHFGLRRSTISIDLAQGTHDIIITYKGNNNGYIDLYWKEKTGPEQKIPPEALSPVRTIPSAKREAYAATISNQRGEILPAELVLKEESVSLQMQKRLSAGTYKAIIPTTLVPKIKDLAATSNSFSIINFAVATDSGESILLSPGEDEIARLSKILDFTLCKSDEEFSRAIHGAKVGKELWRRAAIPLLILLVLEIFLSRWITAQRKLGEMENISFDDAGRPTSKFQEILKTMKGIR